MNGKARGIEVEHAMITLFQLMCNRGNVPEQPKNGLTHRKLSIDMRETLTWLFKQTVIRLQQKVDPFNAVKVPLKYGTAHGRGRVTENGLTPAQRASVSRTLRRLEQRGLVVRINFQGEGHRTTHVELTEEGAKIARGLVESENG
jgi:hypothetical protein